MSVNLLPWREHQQQKRKRLLYGLMSVLIVLLCGGLLLWHIVVVRQHRQQSAKLRHINRTLSKITITVNQLKKDYQHMQALQQRIALLKKAHAGMANVSHLLVALPTLMPRRLVVKQFTQQRSVVTVQGIAASSAAVVAFLVASKKLALLKQVRLIMLKHSATRRLLHFTVKWRLNVR